MRSRARKIVGVVAAIVIAACVDLSAPDDKPASISQIQLPAFFVVQGDTMRDTLGRATPPSIIAYDGAGGVLTSFTPRFVVTDSLEQLHFSAVNGALVSSGPADTAGAVAHVVGQVATLQTGTQTVYVTVRPDTLARVVSATTGTDTLSLVVGTDSASSIATLKLTTAVRGVGGRVVPGVYVRYTLATTVPSKSSAAAAYLLDDANTVFLAGQSTADTGDVSGQTARTLAINGREAPAEMVVVDAVTIVEVVATAMYKGVPLQGSPLHILVPVKAPSFSSRTP